MRFNVSKGGTRLELNSDGRGHCQNGDHMLSVGRTCKGSPLRLWLRPTDSLVTPLSLVAAGGSLPCCHGSAGASMDSVFCLGNFLS